MRRIGLWPKGYVETGGNDAAYVLHACECMDALHESLVSNAVADCRREIESLSPESTLSCMRCGVFANVS